jgi:hypothetical protein
MTVAWLRLVENGLNPKDIGAVLEFFTWIQKYYKVGHAFFRSVKDAETLDRLLRHQLLPLFEKNFRFSPDTLSAIVESVSSLQGKFKSIEADKVEESPGDATQPQ